MLDMQYVVPNTLSSTKYDPDHERMLWVRMWHAFTASRETRTTHINFTLYIYTVVMCKRSSSAHGLSSAGAMLQHSIRLYNWYQSDWTIYDWFSVEVNYDRCQMWGKKCYYFGNTWFHYGEFMILCIYCILYLLLNVSFLGLCYILMSGLFAWTSLTALSQTYLIIYTTTIIVHKCKGLVKRLCRLHI